MKHDAELRFGILEELAYQPAIYSTEIGVCVKDQVVFLDGSRSQSHEKEDRRGDSQTHVWSQSSCKRDPGRSPRNE